MPERSLGAERTAYLRRFQLAVSTISTAVVRLGSLPGLTGATFALAGGDLGVVVRARRNERLGIHLEERVVFVREQSGANVWGTQVIGYRYQLHDDAGAEILAFHLHPGAGDDEPHLHLGAGAGDLRAEFHRAHVPTGRMTCERFLLFAIRDFAVATRRSDYREILAIDRDL